MGKDRIAVARVVRKLVRQARPPKGWCKHIIREGARFHVISYYGGQNPDGSRWAERVCSEPRCEINEHNTHVAIRRIARPA
jgi:hypothetical protein